MYILATQNLSENHHLDKVVKICRNIIEAIIGIIGFDELELRPDLGFVSDRVQIIGYILYCHL